MPALFLLLSAAAFPARSAAQELQSEGSRANLESSLSDAYRTIKERLAGYAPIVSKRREDAAALPFLQSVGNVVVSGGSPFRNRVREDLSLIYATPTGKALIDSVGRSGHRLYIRSAAAEGRIGSCADSVEGARTEDAYVDLDEHSGAGTDVVVTYDHALMSYGSRPARPPAIGLAHELIHAHMRMTGRLRHEWTSENIRVPNPEDPRTVSVYMLVEAVVIGIAPYEHLYPFTENMIRGEWSPPQPLRTSH
ncbi:MAG: M91 family zinc metallopeptidase [Elusimicrobiota bacterium]